MNRPNLPLIFCLAMMTAPSLAAGPLPYRGQATITHHEELAPSLGWADALFAEARARAQTLTVSPASILKSWAPSSDLAGIFAGSTELGEQIALTGAQRWAGPFGGVLVCGHFAPRYVPDINGDGRIELEDLNRWTRSIGSRNADSTGDVSAADTELLLQVLRFRQANTTCDRQR